MIFDLSRIVLRMAENVIVEKVENNTRRGVWGLGWGSIFTLLRTFAVPKRKRIEEKGEDFGSSFKVRHARVGY